MPDSLRRAIRGLIQLVAGGALTAAVSSFANGLTAAQTAEVMAVWTVLVTLAQNVAEDHTNFPSLLKAVPSSGQNPVTIDPAGDENSVSTDPAVWVVPEAAHQVATLANAPAKKAAPVKKTAKKTVPARRS